MHIWFVAQHFLPEPGAPAARVKSLATNWIKQGHTLQVLTGHPFTPAGTPYEGYGKKPAFYTEQMDGMTVARHWLHPSSQGELGQRLWGQISFALSLLRNLFKPSGPKPDVVVASVPTFFAVISAWLIARRFKAKFVLEVRELWPEILVELGQIQPGGLLRFLEKLEKFAYKKADRIVALSQTTAHEIVQKGVPADKVDVVTNGLDDGAPAELEQARKAGQVDRLRTDMQINPLTRVVLYLGHHSATEALGQVIEAAKLLLPRSDILFLLVGEGPDKQRLKKLAQGLPNVQFMSMQPYGRTAAFYAIANVALVPLKASRGVKAFIPSKVFETLGLGVPTVAAVDGEAAELLRTSNATVVVPPEDAEKIAYAVLRIVDHPELAQKMAINGKKWVAQSFMYNTLAQKYLDIFSKTGV